MTVSTTSLAETCIVIQHSDAPSLPGFGSTNVD